MDAANFAYHPYYAARQSTASSHKQSHSARQSYPLTYHTMSMPRSMHDPTRAAMPLTLQTQAPPTSANSSFGDTIYDDSHYLATLPSAVSDFPASDFFLWRDAKYESPIGDSFHMMADCCNENTNALETPDSMPNVVSSCHEQSLWTPPAGPSSLRPAEYQQSPGGMPEDSLLLDPNDRSSNSASLGTSAVSVLGRIDRIYSTRSPSQLAVEVDTSDYDIVQPEQWSYSVTEYDDDDAPSPSSIDTHNSGPRTPADSQPNATFFHMQNMNGYGGASFEQAHPKIATSCGSLSLTTSLPPLIGHAQPALTAASFGNLTFSSAISSQSSSWPMSAVYTSSLYHPNSHGVQTGGPGLISNYEIYQGTQPPPIQPAAVQPAVVQPAVVQPVFHPRFGSVQDFADSGMEASPEACSEDGSESNVDDRLGEDMNDRALHDAQVRRDRDKYLLKMRHEGFSYKEIKRRGNFREAESTLRGRVRVLTKDKADRVRRPEWTEEDLQMLDEAVTRFSGSQGRGRGRDGGRLPWKKVSDYLVHHGSTYHFAAATCARKWKELESR